MRKASFICPQIILSCVLSLVVIPIASADDKSKDSSERLFELRTYTAAPGKLDALHARFRNHTNRLFVKHGMTLVGYWIPTEGPKTQNTLIYILAYPNKEAREKAWKDFQADPEWQKARAESEINGKLVEKAESVFLKPTDYSPIR